LPHLRIYLLGAPEVELDGKPADIKRRKDLALLAYLAVTAQAHRREALAALFWPEHDTSRAFSNLRRSIWELKQLAGEDLLVVERDSVILRNTPEAWLDVAEFQSKVNDPDSLSEAIDLYRGDFMTGFTLPDCHGFDDWQFFTRDELRRAFGTALETQAVELGQAGAFERAIHYAQRWLALDMLNEAAHRMLMTLYTWSGERAAAIRQYQECIRILEEELGLPPEADTTRLLEHIQSGEIDKKRPNYEEMLVPAVSIPTANLPTLPTPFVGRRAELNQIEELLKDPESRMVTLLGPGGVGKTRLAIRAAEESLERYPNGVFFVPLASLSTPQAILPAIAGSLKFSLSAQDESPKDQLLNYLGQKRLLLVMDNFEHLVGGAALIGEIISQAEGVEVLATSREKLELQGEAVYDVGGMRFPDPGTVMHAEQDAMDWLEKEIEDFSAIQLFAQSARRAKAGFRITTENLPAVVHIAQLVRGMPLALELAAAWVPLLSCQEIAEEIERNLDFLESSMQDVPERQRSMRAVFDHTWDLLNEREKETFTRLSVFRGGFTLQAARELFGISPIELRKMVGKSLLARSAGGRFELHELLRQYAAEKLAQDKQDEMEARSLHSAYYCSIMHAWGHSIHTRQQQVDKMVELNADLENALAAWNWAVEQQQIENLDQACEAFFLFLLRRTRILEGMTLLRSARQALNDCSSVLARHLQARLLTWEGTFERSQRNFETAERMFNESLSILEDPEIDQEAARVDRALVHWGLGFNSYQIGDGKKAKTHYEICLKLYQEANMRSFEADVLQDLAGLTAYLIWDAERAEEYWKTALEIKKSLGDQFRVAGIQEELGIIAAYHIGDIDKAISLYQEASDIYLQFGDLASTACSIRCRAQIAHLSARYAESRELWKEQLSIFEELGSRDGLAWAHTNLGLTHISLGEYALSEVHIREALNFLDLSPEEDIQKGIDRWCLAKVLLVTGRLTEALVQIEASLEIDRRMTGKHNLGRDLSTLSLVEYMQGHKENAWAHVQESIELFQQYQHYDWMIYAASTLAVLLADRGECERAFSLYGVITRYPEAATSKWFEDAFWCHIHQACAELPTDVVEAAIGRGRQLDIWGYMQELIEELKSRRS
jgi:predicted ATPase/DNA-binding SARP family transcriptional activator